MSESSNLSNEWLTLCNLLKRRCAVQTYRSVQHEWRRACLNFRDPSCLIRIESSQKSWRTKGCTSITPTVRSPSKWCPLNKRAMHVLTWLTLSSVSEYTERSSLWRKDAFILIRRYIYICNSHTTITWHWLIGRLFTGQFISLHLRLSWTGISISCSSWIFTSQATSRP